MLTVAMLVAAAWSVGWLEAQSANGGVIFASPSHAKFSELPGSKGQVSIAPICGDSHAGAHGTYTKFAPGYDAGMHTHANDVWIVVIKGAYL